MKSIRGFRISLNFYVFRNYTRQIKITDVLPNRSTVRLVMDHKLDKIQIYCKMLEALV